MEREISIILKVKGAKEAKAAVESVFSDAVLGKVTKFTGLTTKAGNATQKMGRQAKGASTQVMTFSKALGRGMAALYLYQRAWNMFGTQFEEGLKLQRASEQFNRNVGNVTKMLPELRSATRGVIADFDLLKTAGRAFQQGLKPGQMASAFKMGTVAAQKLGLGATDAINTITNAITRQDEGSLNTLGIITNVNQAYKTQAALIAKNGGVMSQAMSIQLRQSLILKELRNRFGGVNQVQNDGLAILERFRASWKNFRAALGQTIGIALIPLTRALTGALDVVTALLNKMNDIGAFRGFVQVAGTLAGIWGASKFITGARTLMGLFGIMGGRSIGRTVERVVFKVLLLTRSLGTFGAGMMVVVRNVLGLVSASTALGGTLGKVAGVVLNLTRTIPGLGLIIAGVTLAAKPLLWVMDKLWTSAKVFYQLLSNFDENTGMSKVLKKDAESLGGLYNGIENLAKWALELGAVLKGIGLGIADAFGPVRDMFKWLGTAIDWASDKLEGWVTGMLGFEKISVRSSSRLDQLTEKWRRWTKYIGLAASGLTTVVALAHGNIPLAMVGAVGVAGFGGSLINDALKEYAPASSEQSQSSAQRAQPQVQPQMSTQVTQPDIRPQNQLPGMDAWTEILTKVNKNIEKQNDMMEMDSQKQDIKDSQKQAQSNIWTRR